MKEERGELKCIEDVAKKLNTVLCIIYCAYNRTITL